MIGALTNHLWQSTLFVLAAWIVTLALRRNAAHIRHAVWVVASVKFLVPFALLMSLGSSLPGLTPAATAIASSAATPELSMAVERIAAPFTNADAFLTATSAPATPAATNWTMVALAGVWACGFATIACMRFRGWRRIHAAVRRKVRLDWPGPLPVWSSPGLLEPGVVGVWRPVLLVPEGIERHLTPAQLRAVLEHEFCHVRRRDNLTSAIHMVVEALFWFHPVVWWVGARMVDERERACDEQVLRVCGEPQTYAESILNVCKLYVESPLTCVSGVTGADLKKRVAAIMVNRVGLRLNIAGKVALAATALLAIALPLLAGVVTAPLLAQGAARGEQTPSAKFDVVSIRPCDPNVPAPAGPPAPAGARSGGAPYAARTSPGYVYWHCATLAQLVDQAYADAEHPLLNVNTRLSFQDSFQPKHVRGGPGWVRTDQFTIEAKASPDLTKPTLAGAQSRILGTMLPPAISQALRATLEDRFQLRVRRATEQRDLYNLSIAKSGLNKARVKATTASDCVTSAEYFATDPGSRENLKICGRYFVSRENTWELTGMSLQQLANALSGAMERFVVDRTGIDTPFNLILDLRADADSRPGDGRFIRALEALGLRIEETKGPAEYLVIDSAERPRPNDSMPPVRASGAGTRR
jgi:bla regulator protein blaR1